MVYLRICGTPMGFSVSRLKSPKATSAHIRGTSLWTQCQRRTCPTIEVTLLRVRDGFRRAVFIIVFGEGGRPWKRLSIQLYLYPGVYRTFFFPFPLREISEVHRTLEYPFTNLTSVVPGYYAELPSPSMLLLRQNVNGTNPPIHPSWKRWLEPRKYKLRSC